MASVPHCGGDHAVEQQPRLRTIRRSTTLRRAPAAVAATLIAMATLSACGSSDTDPAAPPAGPSATAVAPGGDVDCHSAGGAELVWDGMVAAKDDWAAWYGTQWRHSYAFTVTSAAEDLTCRYNFEVAARDTVTEEYNYGETIHVVLGPGESWSGQVFYLEEDFEFSSDAKDATPTNPIEPEVVRQGATLVYDGYYDADVTIGKVEGDGAGAVLPVTVKHRGLAKGMLERLWSATEDVFFVRGLDAEGNVVVNAYDWIFPIEEGQTETVNIPLGGGPSNDQKVMNFYPTSALDEVVSWELAAFQPVMLEDAAAGYVEP